MICHICGSEIQEDIVICPCCGAVQPNKYADAQNPDGAGNVPYRGRKYNKACVLGCLLTCAGFFLYDYVLIMAFPIAGIIISTIGLKEINVEVEQGKVLAIVGIILGALQIICKGLIFALFMIV